MATAPAACWILRRGRGAIRAAMLLRNLTVDLGLRYDYFDLVDTGVRTSSRLGLAYHFKKTNSVLHAVYNRYFSPPPIEYSLLAGFIANHAADCDQRVGNVRAYTQNYFEVGWAQERPRVSLKLKAYLRTGHNSFEKHEISISRIFVPVNFHTAPSETAELVLNLRQLEQLGISGQLQYALAKIYFLRSHHGRLRSRPNRCGRESASCPRLTRLTPARHRFSTTIAGAGLGRQRLALWQRNHHRWGAPACRNISLATW